MLTFTTEQERIINSNYKLIAWLFDVNNRHLEFDAQTGKFTPGNLLYQLTDGIVTGTAKIETISKTSSTTGRLILSSIVGTFVDDRPIYEATYGDELLTYGDFHLDTSWTITGTGIDINPEESPSESPSISQSPSLSPSASESPSESPSVSPSASESPSESPSVSPSYSESPSESPSVSPSPSASPSESPSYSVSPSYSLSPSASESPSESPSGSPSGSLSPSASESPSESPSVSPSYSESPSESPSVSPSASESPSESPSVSPSYSESPSLSPSLSPSASESSSESPSISPSQARGVCRFLNAVQTSSHLDQEGVTSIGKYYKFEGTVSNYIKGSIIANGGYHYIDSDGDFTDIFYSELEDFRILAGDAGGTSLDLDDLSLMEVINAAMADGTVVGDRYYWSTRLYPGTGDALYFDEDKLWIGDEGLTFDDQPITGINYEYKIIPESFNGITTQSNLTESGQYNATKLSFSIINENNELTASDFAGAVVHLRLAASDRISASVISSWKFIINQANPFYEIISVECDDFIASIMESEYPNTAFISDLFAPTESDKDNDPFCIPKTFGTAYIPLKSVEISTYLRGYLIGDDGDTFTVNKITSPREFDSRQTWTVNDATFRISAHEDRSGNYDWNILFPFILKMDDTNYSGRNYLARSNICTDTSKAWAEDELVGLLATNYTDLSIGIITSNTATSFTCILEGGTSNSWGFLDTYLILSSGLWKDQSSYVNPLFEFSNSSTVDLTSPENIAKAILEDVGVSSSNIDSAITFDEANSTFEDWDLNLEGGCYYKRPVSSVLAEIMNSSHSVLDITDKIRWRIRSKTSQATITGSDILENSFNYSLLTQIINDSGNIAFAPVGRPHDVLIKAVVPAKNMTDNPSSDVLPLPMLHDSSNAQKAGTLYFQRKFLKEANLSFSGKSSLFGIQPDDVITISDDDYGGEYDVLVNNIHIGKMLSLGFNCTKYKVDLDDWDDLDPGAITLATDGTTSYWQQVVAGPESVSPSFGYACHLIPGHMRIGSDDTFVFINSTLPYICIRDISGSETIRFGNLKGTYSYTEDTYGIEIGYGGDLVFHGSLYGMYLNSSALGNYFCIDEYLTEGNTEFWIGSNYRPDYFGVDTVTGIALSCGHWFDMAIDNEDQDVQMTMNMGAYSGAGYHTFSITANSVQRYIEQKLNSSATWTIYPNVADECALGTNTKYYATSYATSWTNPADFYYLDKVIIGGIEVEIDDIEAIKSIKPSGVYEEATGLMLIDDESIPDWLILKHRKDAMIPTGKCKDDIQVYMGDPVYDETGTKPFLDLKTMISLCMGAIRKLDDKIIDVDSRVKVLE